MRFRESLAISRRFIPALRVGRGGSQAQDFPEQFVRRRHLGQLQREPQWIAIIGLVLDAVGAVLVAWTAWPWLSSSESPAYTV
jgi:hypothetical protein